MSCLYVDGIFSVGPSLIYLQETILLISLRWKTNCSLQVLFHVVFINHLFKDVMLDLKEITNDQENIYKFTVKNPFIKWNSAHQSYHWDIYTTVCLYTKLLHRGDIYEIKQQLFSINLFWFSFAFNFYITLVTQQNCSAIVFSVPHTFPPCSHHTLYHKMAPFC